MGKRQDDVDERMLHRPAIASFMRFDISEPMITQVSEPRQGPSLTMWLTLRAATEIRLESPQKTLRALKGRLSIGRRWDDRDQRRGYIHHEAPEFLSIDLGLSEEEWEETTKLLSWGFLPRALEIGFDVMQEEHFEGQAYWDDVRHPSVIIDGYSLDWAPLSTTKLLSRHFEA